MKHPFLALMLIALLVPAARAVQVTTTIDPFTTAQIIQTNNATSTATISAPGAIGGFRTMTLTTAGGDPPEIPPNTSITVSASTQRFSLNTPAGATSAFELKWGGAGGTSGLGADFGAGQPIDLFTSFLSFSLRSTDQSSNFTWQFIDALGNTASYTDTFPVHSSSSPLLPYDIALNSFSNASNVDWSSIDYIIFSGGGLEVDTTIPAPLQIVASTVPEPGTYALLSIGLALIAMVTARRARSSH